MKTYRILAATLAIVALCVLGAPSGAPRVAGIPTAVTVAAQAGVMTGYLSDNILLTKVEDHTAAGTADVESASVDMANYTGVVFVTSYGTAATDNGCHIESSSDDGSADTFADLTGTETLSGSSDEDVWIDMRNPRERYVRAECLRGTSTTLESIWAIQYGGRSLPTDNTTTGTIIGEKHNSPAEGTK